MLSSTGSILQYSGYPESQTQLTHIPVYILGQFAFVPGKHNLLPEKQHRQPAHSAVPLLKPLFLEGDPTSGLAVQAPSVLTPDWLSFGDRGGRQGSGKLWIGGCGLTNAPVHSPSSGQASFSASLAKGVSVASQPV